MIKNITLSFFRQCPKIQQQLRQPWSPSLGEKIKHIYDRLMVPLHPRQPLKLPTLPPIELKPSLGLPSLYDRLMISLQPRQPLKLPTLPPIELKPSLGLPSAIEVVSVKDFGVDPDQWCQELKKIDLKPDEYELRRQQIEYLEEKVGFINLSLRDDYYQGRASYEEIKHMYDRLATPQQKKEFDDIKPYRFRAISTFKLSFEGQSWKINRIPTQIFVQQKELSVNLKFDHRIFPRRFHELDDFYASSPNFRATLVGVAENIKKRHPNVTLLEVIVHNTRIETREKPISNSPEGIHQDGFPYIVSAIVVDRDNVTGGQSIIYEDDKKTQIFKTVLQPGYGIVQPDHNTKLWHIVETIKPENGNKPGSRTSIGFDIKIVK